MFPLQCIYNINYCCHPIFHLLECCGNFYYIFNSDAQLQSITMDTVEKHIKSMQQECKLLSRLKEDIQNITFFWLCVNKDYLVVSVFYLPNK